jgi:hypothetical protein
VASVEKIRKVLIILFGHLWGVELTYRYIFLKFTLRCKHSNIVPILPPVFDECKKWILFILLGGATYLILTGLQDKKQIKIKMFISDLKTIYIDCLHYNECFSK